VRGEGERGRGREQGSKSGVERGKGRAGVREKERRNIKRGREGARETLR